MPKILKPHQRKMLAYTMRVQHPALFVKMRLGKTLVAIRRCKVYANCPHILVCAPYSAFIAWEDELRDDGEVELIEISGKSKDRKQILDDHWDTHKWFIASKESNKWAPEVLLANWDVVIVDEGTFIKEPKASVSKFFMKHFRDVKHRWDLTGTPDPNSSLDYYCQLKFLDKSYLSQYRTFWDFRDKAFTLANERKYTYEITRQGRKNLTDCLSKNCFFMDRKQAGIKEQRIDQIRYLQMPAKLMKVYLEIEEEFALKISKDEELLTKWAPVRYMWMKDLCNGFLEEEFIWPGKLNEIKYLLKTELKGEKVIIYANRVKYLKMLYRELGKGYKFALVYGDTPMAKRKLIYRAFQQGKLDGLICNPECVQYSLDFSIADTVFHYDQAPQQVRLQADERIFHMDKQGALLYLNFLIKDTVESVYYENRLLAEDDSHMLRIFVKRLKEKYELT